MDGTGTAELDGEAEAVAPLAGKVASAPSRTLTWPAATAVLAVAVTPNCEAILPALAEAPVP